MKLVTSQVLRMVSVKIMVTSYVIQCNFVHRYQHSRGTC